MKNPSYELDLLIRIGTALYGIQWQKPMGMLLGVRAETVNRWVHQHKRVVDSHQFWHRLLAAVETRRDVIDCLLAELRSVSASDDPSA